MAPLIASILGTLLQNGLPKVAQAVVEKGQEYVEEKLGVKLEPDMSQAQIQELKLRVMQHEEFLVEQEQRNTADARDMQKVALQQDDVFSKRFVYVFASFWSICAAVYIGFITFGTIPLDNVRFADTILGFILGTVISTILNYFFGSSSGSAKKTELLGKGIQDARQ